LSPVIELEVCSFRLSGIRDLAGFKGPFIGLQVYCEPFCAHFILQIVEESRKSLWRPGVFIWTLAFSPDSIISLFYLFFLSLFGFCLGLILRFILCGQLIS